MRGEWVMAVQPGFADLALAHRLPSALERIATLINWGPVEHRLAKLVQPTGRPPFAPLLMLRALLDRLGIAGHIQTRASKHHPLSPEAIARNQAIGHIRGRVETVFAVIKTRYRMARSRYVGRVKTELQFTLAAIAFNLRRALRLDEQGRSLSAA